MAIDLPATLRLLSHELRTPVGVIQGYLKMLMDGRVEEHMRPKIIAQIQRAAARVAAIGQQASDLSHWISNGSTQACQEISVRHLVEEVSARAPASLKLTHNTAGDYLDNVIRTPDPSALVEAGGALVEAVVKSYGTHAAITVSKAEDAGVDFWVTALTSGRDGPLDSPRPNHERRPVAYDEAGLGLSLLIASAIVAAHGGRLWQHTGHISFGMTLPWSHKT